jgi:hypothetical protein
LIELDGLGKGAKFKSTGSRLPCLEVMARDIVAGVGSETIPLKWGDAAGKGIDRAHPVAAGRFLLGRIVGGGVCNELPNTDDPDHIAMLEDEPTLFASILTTIILPIEATTCRLTYKIYICGHVPASRAYLGQQLVARKR